MNLYLGRGLNIIPAGRIKSGIQRRVAVLLFFLRTINAFFVVFSWSIISSS